MLAPASPALYDAGRMKPLLLLLAGMALGCAITLGTLMLSGGWYEYHLAEKGDDVVSMVNRNGWELLPQGLLRRPRLRLH